MDIREKAGGEMNWLEIVLHKIPGFKGYYDREFRRDADHLQREFIVARLLAVKNSITLSTRTVSRQKNLSLLTEYDLFTKRLEKITNEIRFADQGYSGFFDFVKVREEQLDSIYRLDSEMVDLTACLNNEANNLSKLPEPNGLKLLEEYLNKLTAMFQKRSALLKGYQE